jgi:hypothetical protein
MSETIDVWFTSLSQPRPCRDEGCGKGIVWGEVKASGKRMLFDAPAVPLRTYRDDDSGQLVAVMDRTTVHWATCPGSEKFRKERDRARQ